MNGTYVNLHSIFSGTPYGVGSAERGESVSDYEHHMSVEVLCASCADKKTRSDWVECDGCDAAYCPMKNYNP